MNELERIEALDKTMLVAEDIAPYLMCTAHTIRVAARKDKSNFPFPIIVMGTTVRIPKVPFLKAMRGEA